MNAVLIRRATRRLLTVSLVVGAGALTAAVLASGSGGHSGVGDAVELAEDDSRFDSSSEAGETFALIASVMMDDARACLAERSGEEPRCVALSEGAAYVQTVAVVAATCTGPGVFEIRTRTLEYLRAIERMGDTGPPVAALPRRCS